MNTIADCRNPSGHIFNWRSSRTNEYKRLGVEIILCATRFCLVTFFFLFHSFQKKGMGIAFVSLGHRLNELSEGFFLILPFLDRSPRKNYVHFRIVVCYQKFRNVTYAHLTEILRIVPFSRKKKFLLRPNCITSVPFFFREIRNCNESCKKGIVGGGPSRIVNVMITAHKGERTFPSYLVATLGIYLCIITSFRICILYLFVPPIPLFILYLKT